MPGRQTPVLESVSSISAVTMVILGKRLLYDLIPKDRESESFMKLGKTQSSGTSLT